METVTGDSGYLEANRQVAFEEESLGAIQDEEFDFDIGGTGDSPEEALGGFESSQDGLPHHSPHDDALHGCHTKPLQAQGVEEAADESHEDGISGQDQGQNYPAVSALDASADAEGAGQAYQFDYGHSDEAEDGNAQESGGPQYGDHERYQDEVYLEDTADQLVGFDEVGQKNEEMARSMTVATATVESSHLEDEHLEDDVHEDFSAQETDDIQAGDETQPPADSEYDDGTVGNETTETGFSGMEPAPNTNPGDDPYPLDTATDLNSAGTGYGLDEGGEQKADSQKVWEQRPRVRVSYGTAEFYLFAESPDADPDDYFFENADILHQPLSQFLPKLRQVITEDLQASDELLVKVDGLGLEFGEATTKDFLEQTTFGQVIELYERLVKLDSDASEAPELYVYLGCRPNCLYRLSELASHANEGKGLSDIAFYYEATPDLAAIEELSKGYDRDRQGMDSEDLSENGSNDPFDGELSATHETEQPYNPFRLTESQQQALDATHSSLAEAEVADNSLSAHDDEKDTAYGDDNDESLPPEVQDDLELAAEETSPDIIAPEAAQDSNIMPGEDEVLDAGAADEEPEGQYDVGEDLPGGEQVIGTEADTAAGNQTFQKDNDGPTDEAQAMVDSERRAPVSEPQLVREALADVHQANVTAADWSSNFSSIGHGGDLPAADLDYNNHTENISADLSMQDYDTAENDDYLDIGATEEDSAEPAEYPASPGTPGPTSHDSSATATLDGEGHGQCDDVSATQSLTIASHLAETASRPEPGPPETETDEIHWNDDEDDENDYDNDEVGFANQIQTDLSPSSLSVKRGRQADEDDVGLGDDSIAKRRRT